MAASDINIDEFVKIWNEPERMKYPNECKKYNGYFNQSSIQDFAKKLSDTSLEVHPKQDILRIGASLNFDIDNLLEHIKNFHDNESLFMNILIGYLQRNSISDWNFYQKLRKILRRNELQHNSNAVISLTSEYVKWMMCKKMIKKTDILQELITNENNDNSIKCINEELKKLKIEKGSLVDSDSVYLLFKIYSNLIVYCKADPNKKEIIRFKDKLELQLTPEFYYCFFPYRREHLTLDKVFAIETKEQHSYSNQTLIEVVDAIIPSCLFSCEVPELEPSCKVPEQPSCKVPKLEPFPGNFSQWGKHLIRLNRMKSESDDFKKTLERFEENHREKEEVSLYQLESKKSQFGGYF